MKTTKDTKTTKDAKNFGSLVYARRWGQAPRMTLPNAEERLSVLEAYDAMHAFLHAYWERGGRASEDLASLLSSTQRLGESATLDPAQWHDWLKAVAAIRGRNGGGA